MKQELSLVHLVSMSNKIEEMLTLSDGEITPQIEEMLTITETHLPQKIDSYAWIIDRFENLQGFFKARAEMFLKASKAAENVSLRCRDNLKMAMETMKVDVLPGVDIKAQLVNCPKSVQIDDPDKIPDEYITIKTIEQPDKKAILRDLEAGLDVPGAKVVRNRTLRIKPNA